MGVSPSHTAQDGAGKGAPSVQRPLTGALWELSFIQGPMHSLKCPISGTHLPKPHTFLFCSVLNALSLDKSSLQWVLMCLIGMALLLSNRRTENRYLGHIHSRRLDSTN